MVVSNECSSIFDSRADTLVCPVNCVGVMGNGLALAFRNRCKGLYEAYRGACLNGELEPGKLWLYTPSCGPRVLCFPTKTTWRLPSKREYIAAGLATLVDGYKERNIKRIAIPPLGCGQGQLDYELCIKPLLLEYLQDLPDLEVELLVYR